MEKDNLALELLMQLKSTIKRLFAVIVILLIALIVTNLAWLYYWNLPTNTTTESYQIQSEDNGNAVYNESGEINVNGEYKDN
nr:MAG TPA: immunity protein [Caudoviricetes sp.]